MSLFGETTPVSVGDAAPSFQLPRLDTDGTVSLEDYRGRPVLLALVRGLWCPFCRRALANIGAVRDDLAEAGVTTLGIVAAEIANARRYLRYRPTRIPLAADPALVTHALYGLPRPPFTAELMAAVGTIRTDADGVLPEPLPFQEAAAALDRLDGYEHSADDEADIERGMTQLNGHFLIDGAGIVRWTDIECAREGIAGLGHHPFGDELIEAARSLG